jgi:hypothetical protein
MGAIYIPIEETGPRISGSQEYDIMKDIDIVWDIPVSLQIKEKPSFNGSIEDSK